MKREAWNIALAVVAVVLLAAAGPWFVGQLRSLPPSTRLAARSDQKVVTLEVSGMTCPACAAKISSELDTTPGVSACEVRPKQMRAYVVCEKSTPDSAIVNAVLRAGPGYLAGVVRQ